MKTNILMHLTYALNFPKIDEPIHKSFGGYPERVKEIDDLVTEFLNYGGSLMILDPSNDNKVIGIRMAYTLTRDQIQPKVTRQIILRSA